MPHAAPSCVAGAMLYKSSDGGIYASLEVISVGIAVIVQSVALFGAFHFIAKMAVNNQKELEAIEDDMEVGVRSSCICYSLWICRFWL